MIRPATGGDERKPPATTRSIWFLVDVGYACGGVVVRSGRVVDCAPIFRRWMMGEQWSEIERKVKALWPLPPE